MAYGATTTDDRVRGVAKVTLPVIAVILTGWALKATYPVTMPLAFAFFLAVLVYPIQHWVEERVPDRVDWLGVVAAMLTVVAVLAIVGVLIWLSVEMVGNKAPQYIDKFQGYWNNITQWARQHNIPIPQDLAGVNGLTNRITSWIATIVRSVWWALAVLVLIFFFALLMLVEVYGWRKKAHTAFRGPWRERVVETVGVVANKMRWYLIGLTAISLLSGTITALWFLILGIDLAFVWGLITFIFNYVPIIGSIVSVLLATLFVVVAHGWLWALIAFLGRLVTEQVVGNYIQPLVQGRILDISPLVVLIAITFWGWAWGIAGVLLAVPLTATIMIVCAHIEPLRPVALLLSRTGDERAIANQTDHGR